MKAYCRGGLVLATHTDEQTVAASAYGEGVSIVTLPNGTLVEIGQPLPALDLATRRTVASAEIDVRRDAILTAGYVHDFGGSAGVRTLDNRNEKDAINWLGLKGLVDAKIADGNGGDLVALRDASNTNFTASAATVADALLAMAAWRASVLAVSWSLKDAVASAADEAALDLIDLDAGWPA